MNLHEYQAKELLQQFGVAVPRGTKVTSQQEAVEAAKALGGPLWVVKAQVHAGGAARPAASSWRAASRMSKKSPAGCWALPW